MAVDIFIFANPAFMTRIAVRSARRGNNLSLIVMLQYWSSADIIIDNLSNFKAVILGPNVNLIPLRLTALVTHCFEATVVWECIFVDEL